MRRLAEELGIDARCDWIAWVSDQQRLELLNRCRGLILASLWEGFGLPALEAMACGAPVIASTAGALPEVVGEAALLVDPLSPGAITAAMTDLIHQPLLGDRLSVAGLLQARCFSWVDTARQVEGLLRDLA